MRADLNLTNNNTSFGMALLRPANEEGAKAFGKYFRLHTGRFKRGVKQIQKEQANYTFTNIKHNAADNSVRVFTQFGYERVFPATKSSQAGKLVEGAKTPWATTKAIVRAVYDLLFNPKKVVKSNLYEAGEFAKQLERDYAKELAAQLKKAAAQTKRETKQAAAVEEIFMGQK